MNVAVISSLHLQPITLREASAFVERHHRHHGPSRGHLFSLAVNDGHAVVGVVVVGRPTARGNQDGWTAEVTRLCTLEGAPMGAASKLYSAARRAAQALGYRRVITYILATEDGMSLRGAGWTSRYLVRGRTWSCPSRPRVDTHPITDKQLWEAQS